jgi:integrase
MGIRRIKTFGGQKMTFPIKDPKMLDRVFDYLKIQIDEAKTEIKEYQAHRNYLFFLIGVNTAFRAEDLLQLRVTDLIKGYVSIKENKTGKMQNFRMNKELHDQILEYIEKYKLKDNSYLFMGQKKKDTYKGVTRVIIYPMTRQSARNICLKVAAACGIDFRFGVHSLRKTFGYMYIKEGKNIMTLMKMYNHDHPVITMLYVMWDKDDAETERESSYLGPKKQRKRKSC